MFKVLIADDEPKFREYLYKSINWAEHGFEICGQARNGIEALEIALKECPDIALLDINMPLMDGIVLTERLNEVCKGIAIILITGYSEFEYARKAVKLGVVDYVLKPFRKEELLSTLIKLKAKLQRIRDEELHAKDDATFLKESFFNMLISDEYNNTDDETIRIFNRLSININPTYFYVAAIEIDNLYQLGTIASEISLWKFAVANILSEMVISNSAHLVFNGQEGRIISILNFKDKESMYQFNTSNYQEFCDTIKKYLDFSVSVGIGQPVISFKELRQSYLEAILVLQEKMPGDFGKVIKYSPAINENRKTGFYRIEFNDKILMALRMNEVDGVKAGLVQVFEYIKKNSLSIEYTYTIIMGLISICLSYITEMGEDINNILGNDFSPYTYIKNRTTLEDSFEWLLNIYGKTATHFNENRTSRSTKIVDWVKNYIRQNYMDSDLSVEKIAHNIYLDSSYIRKVFAKESDSTVVDFITSYRMKKSIALLSEDNVKLSDVAETVGYSDPGYFSKCFKKHFGVSPSQYLLKKK